MQFTTSLFNLIKDNIIRLNLGNVVECNCLLYGLYAMLHVPKFFLKLKMSGKGSKNSYRLVFYFLILLYIFSEYPVMYNYIFIIKIWLKKCQKRKQLVNVKCLS